MTPDKKRKPKAEKIVITITDAFDGDDLNLIAEFDPPLKDGKPTAAQKIALKMLDAVAERK